LKGQQDKSIHHNKMTTLQQLQFDFNTTQSRIELLYTLKSTTVSYMQLNLLKNIKELESKLAEIAMELTAERHAMQY
jgi:hypothetical protein